MVSGQIAAINDPVTRTKTLFLNTKKSDLNKKNTKEKFIFIVKMRKKKSSVMRIQNKRTNIFQNFKQVNFKINKLKKLHGAKKMIYSSNSNYHHHVTTININVSLTTIQSFILHAETLIPFFISTSTFNLLLTVNI